METHKFLFVHALHQLNGVRFPHLSQLAETGTACSQCAVEKCTYVCYCGLVESTLNKIQIEIIHLHKCYWNSEKKEKNIQSSSSWTQCAAHSEPIVCDSHKQTTEYVCCLARLSFQLRSPFLSQFFIRVCSAVRTISTFSERAIQDVRTSHIIILFSIYSFSFDSNGTIRNWWLCHFLVHIALFRRNESTTVVFSYRLLSTRNCQHIVITDDWYLV